jgi:hypothetical protein
VVSKDYQACSTSRLKLKYHVTKVGGIQKDYQAYSTSRLKLKHHATKVGVAPSKPVTRGRRKQETRQRYPVGEVTTKTHLSKA